MIRQLTWCSRSCLQLLSPHVRADSGPRPPTARLGHRSASHFIALPLPSPVHPITRPRDMGDEPTSVAVADTPAAVPISSNESEGRNTLPDLAGSIEPSAARGTAAGAVHESSGTDGAVTKPEEQETRPAEQQATASTSLTSTADGGVTGDAASVQSTGAAGGLPSIPPAAPSAPAPAAALASTVRAPSPSVSPAPTSKKFASSLSVNRKFLEKASTEKVKEAPKVAIGESARSFVLELMRSPRSWSQL